MLMSDLVLSWGADLAVGSTGDLATVGESSLGQQRVLRRLLTNPDDYVWHPDYGAGLAAFIGSTVAVAQIQAIIQSQLGKEPAVAPSPAPVVAVTAGPSGGQFNSVSASVQYMDADSAQLQQVNLAVGG
jgi:hypothetical protein